MLSIDEIKLKTNAKFIGKKIHLYDEIDSTNLEAFRLIEAGNASSGDIILAKSQSNGKGQGQNSWISPKGNLYISIISVTKSTQYTHLLTFVAGMAVVSALKSLYGINVQLKWVNDIVFDFKKLGGILTEVRTNGSISSVITGIGLNLNHKVVNLNNPLFSPISLAEILDKDISINEVVAELIENFENYINLYHNSPQSLIYLWKKNSFTLGKEFLFSENLITQNGKAIDVDENGFLIVDTCYSETKIIKCTKSSNIVYL